MNDQQPPLSPDGHHWWDGQAWRPVQGQPRPGFSGPAPLPPRKRRSPLIWVLIGIPVAIVGLCGVVGVLATLGSTGGIAGTSAVDLGGDEGKKYDMPTQERKFLSIVGSAQAQAKGASEFEIVEARKERGTAACALLGTDLAITDWIGEVAEASTTMGGDGAVLEVHVADGVKLATWNNSMSDIGDGTVIDSTSPLWKDIAKLKKGDRVAVSGSFIGDQDSCLRESSLIDANGVKTPTFIFKFTAVGGVDD